MLSLMGILTTNICSKYDHGQWLYDERYCLEFFACETALETNLSKTKVF